MRPALLLASLLACTACGHYGERDEEDLSGGLVLPPGTETLRIRLPGGPLTVTSDGPPGRVEYTMRTLRAADTPAQLEILRHVELRPQLVTPVPGIVELVVGSLPPGADERQNRLVCRTVLKVPPDVAIEGSTAIGPVAAIERRAAVRLETGSGPVRLDHCSADCTVRTTTGDVMVNAHRGSLDAETGHGMIQVWIDALGDRGLHLTNRQGSVQVHVPSDASFTLDARAEIAALKVADKVRNSFGIPLRPSGDIGAVMRGSVGQGGPPIVIRAFRGRASLGARD